MSQFDFGRVISRTFETFIGEFKSIFLIAFVTIGLSNIVTSLLPSIMGQGPMVDPTTMGIGIYIWIFVITLIVTLIAALVAKAAITKASYDRFTNQNSSLSENLSFGIRYILPLLGAGILVAICLFFGWLFFIFPALIIMTIWAVVTPSIVIDKKGVFEALSHSSELTSGYRWQIFGLFLIYLIAVIVFMGVIMALSFAIGFSGGIATGTSTLTMPVIFAITVITAIIQCCMAMIGAIGISSLHYELSQAKGGSSGAKNAVFD